jgi:glycosyl transferase family 2/glycosyl transferase family 1
MAPTVSVVIATYNFEPFLARAIDSALAQDYPAEALEVIVVDDGSTDGTPELMRAYDGRVKYIRKENGGHLSTFDRGIGEATGDYIALLDGDDEWLPHKLREQVGLLEARPDLGLVHGDMRVVDGDGNVLADSFFAERNIVNVEGDLLWALLRHNTITTSAVLVRASLRDRFHPIPAWARVQDWWISLRVAEVAGIGCIHEPIADYRRHGSNINHGRHGRRRAELLRAELPLRRWLLTGSAIEKLCSRDAAAAFTALERAADGAAESLGLTRRELLPADRAAGEKRLALGRAADDVDVATRHFVAALAHDPWNAMARRALAEAGRTTDWIVAPAATASAPLVAAPVREGVDGAQSFVTLADAAELGAHPELLAAYAEEFGAGDDATLVIRLGSEPEALAGLEAAVAAAGLDGDDAADLLAVPARGPGALSLARLAPSVDAVLSSSLPEGPLAALPCMDATGVAALGALARAEGESWAINICAPNWWTARSWGDLHFARAIQQELARRGRPAAIHVIDQWERSRNERFDVVVHLKGLTTYEPNPTQVNLLWNISHPEKLTAEECERSDVVLVASEQWAGSLRMRVSVPVAVLEQATDPAVFFPETDTAHVRDLVFVGNSRKVMRPVLADLLPTGHDLAVWGSDWEGLIDARHVVGTYLPNDEVRRAYSSAAIVLNDHWADMREHGFASNRLYDAVACGALVVSDRIDGLEERFGGAVVTYDTADELRTIVDHFLANPGERAARGASGRELVLATHTFAHRVDALLEHADAALAAAAAR